VLQDIADIRYFKIRVNQAKQVTDFFYRHGRLLNAMREKTGGRDLSNQVPGSMGSRNENVVRGTLLKLVFNTTITRLFPRSRNGTNVPGTRNVAKFPVPGY
jgi:hypothetical protein